MDSRPPGAASTRRAQAARGRRLGAWTFAVGAHALVLFAMAASLPRAQTEFDPEPITVALVTLTPPQVPPPPKQTPRPNPAPVAKAAPPKAAPPKAPPKSAPAPALARQTLAPAPVSPLRASAVTAPNPGQGMSDSALAGASTADSGDGGGGRPCNMARRVQDALRKDPLVQTAVAGLGARAVRVWDGDWVWIDGEDGKGLTAVRQAMMWEIAFAPPECRGQAMHGLVVLSPDRSGTRLVVGLGDWRWSDLLTPHPRSARD